MLPVGSGGKANDKDKENMQNCDLKQNIRYFEEGIDEAEVTVPSNIVKVAAGKESLSVVGECVVGNKENKTFK